MRCELRRMVTGKSFWLAFFLGVVGMMAGIKIPNLDTALEAGTYIRLVQEVFSTKIIYFLMPVVSVLVWSDSYLAEVDCGFLKASLPRCGYACYVQSKVVATAAGGLLVWWLACAAVLTGSFLIFFPMEKTGAAPAQLWMSLLQTLGRVGLLGASLATLGGICGAASGSVYMAYGLPFTLYYFLMILQERYFPEALWLYPPQWIGATAEWGAQSMGLWLFLLIFLSVLMGMYGGILYGRIHEG